MWLRLVDIMAMKGQFGRSGDGRCGALIAGKGPNAGRITPPPDLAVSTRNDRAGCYRPLRIVDSKFSLANLVHEAP